MGQYFTAPAKITTKQAIDTAMAVVLILLIVALVTDHFAAVKFAVVCLIVGMVVPGVFRPLATVWLGFSQVLGTVASKIILSILFFGIVWPVGLVRRLMGHDTLRLKQFKAGTGSVMHNRDHTYQESDLKNPY